jgi:hypothetical protein
MYHDPWASSPSTHRLISGSLVLLSESRRLDRWRISAQTFYPSGGWQESDVWWGVQSPVPDTVSEIETALTAPLEAAIIARWGIQAVLL